VIGFDAAVRATEVLMALAVTQQSLEQMVADRPARPWLALRVAFCLLVLAAPALAGFGIWGLMALGLWWLARYDGPFNGGADKMTLLILFCLSCVHLAPSPFWAEMAFAYLAVQLVLSYVISGQVKLANPAWRRGEALSDVFLFSAYPVADDLRALAKNRWVTYRGAWVVMFVEVSFPVFLLHPLALLFGLTLAALFHLSNAFLFGLNRFFWIWLSAYPALIWFQGRLFG
jgi:hypothetical protein